MPVVNYSSKDLLRGRVVTPAWYLMKIESVGEAPSKDGGSTNYPVEGTIVKNMDNGSDEYAGVPIDWNFNSKAMGFSRGFLESLMPGQSLEAGKNYELKNAEGELIEVFVENDTWQGRTVNRVNHKYRPVSK